MVTTTTLTLYITKNKTLLINTNRDIKVMAHWYSNTKCINPYTYSGAYRLFIFFLSRKSHIVIIVHYQYSYKLKFTEWENSGGPNQAKINQDPLLHWISVPTNRTKWRIYFYIQRLNIIVKLQWHRFTRKLIYIVYILVNQYQLRNQCILFWYIGLT